MAKKIIIYTFAFIGFLSILLNTIDIVKKNKKANEYQKNCEQIQPGMKVSEARFLMNDTDDQSYGSRIWTRFNTDLSKEYSLVYPGKFPFSEIQTTIYFDPVTQLVTKVYCGE